MKHGQLFQMHLNVRKFQIDANKGLAKAGTAAFYAFAFIFAIANVTGCAGLPPGASPASLTVTPSDASFGNVPVGASNSQTIKVQNSGKSGVTLSQVTISGSGFKLADVPPSVTIAAGNSITFNAVFTPPSAANFQARVTLVAGTDVVASVPLSGTGVTTRLSLSASTLSESFGSVALGTTKSLPVILTNEGNMNITISHLTTTGVGFKATGVTGGSLLKPGQSATLETSFDPTTVGAETGQISITSNATSSPTISLSGTGVEQTAASVSLHWGDAAAVLGYYVYRGTTSGGPYAKLDASLVASPQYVDSTVTPGKTYYYVVTSVDASHVESSFSNQAEAPIPLSP